ncbi:hypothetical protein EJB05_07544 [Eragrostis curvula]|uniref:cysteine synthase n=1 Tax=Eragrostis curvula TaxID=38414 RepID=A0A5J9WJ88_9POAL|nr:hypothetical protein EJB05_07544 [Eragrostis curvula]
MGSLGEVDHGNEMFHGHGHSSDPVIDELRRLENLLREKERELGQAHNEIKGLKVTEALKDKAISELSKELKKQDEKMRSLEKQLEQKNLDVKRLSNERKEALSAQFAAEATLRRMHSSQKDEEAVPFDAIIAPLESDIKKYRHEIAVLQDDNKALERHLKLKEAALVEAGNILRSALERALIVEDVQNQNIELKKQMEIYHEENKLLEKSNRQKVLEIEKLSHTISELEESILATGDVANAVNFYKNQASKLKEEKKTLERELARAKVYVNRVASTAANEWKDDSDKLMPVKRWLEERRLLQGEIQRLRDKITIAEKSAKIEAQLNDKLKRRLKSLEEDMRNETSNTNAKENNRMANVEFRMVNLERPWKTREMDIPPMLEAVLGTAEIVEAQPKTTVRSFLFRSLPLELTMAAATAAGAAAAAAAVSLVACYLLLHKSSLKIPWPLLKSTSGASHRRTRRRGLVEAIGNTPLIRINSLSDATGCEILGKAEFLNPGGSVKDRVAVKIIEEALESGDLFCGGMVTEGSAGSTAISLATVAPAYGCRCHVVIPDDAAIEKMLNTCKLLTVIPNKSQIIEALGATVERVRPVSITHKDHFVNIARRRALEANDLATAQRESSRTQTNDLAHVSSETTYDKLASAQRKSNNTQANGSAHISSEMPHSGKCYPNSDSKGGFFADQFENMANYRAHYEWTGPEIWEHTKGTLHAFVAAAGTGGTIAGVSRYLKEKNRNIKCFLMDPPGSGLFNKVTRGVMYTKEEAEGKRLKNPFDTITEGIGINRVTKNFMMAELDGAYRGTDREAVEMSRFLLRNDGLFLGSSSAMNCVGAVRVAQDLGPGHTIVTILCDSGMRHLSKFFNDQYLADHGLTPTASGLEFLDK